MSFEGATSRSTKKGCCHSLSGQFGECVVERIQNRSVPTWANPHPPSYWGEICPVRALQTHGRENPGWLNESGAVVFQYQGVGITRERVSELLRLAAVAEGFPAHLIGSRSLRKEKLQPCCLALMTLNKSRGLEAGYDAVHAYLYSDHTACPDRAKAMLRSTPVLHPSQRPRSPSFK